MQDPAEEEVERNMAIAEAALLAPDTRSAEERERDIAKNRSAIANRAREKVATERVMEITTRVDAEEAAYQRGFRHAAIQYGWTFFVVGLLFGGIVIVIVRAILHGTLGGGTE